MLPNGLAAMQISKAHKSMSEPTNTTPSNITRHSNDWPLFEIFVRSKQGLEHKHCGSLHAADANMALHLARDVYTRRQEGVSIWVVASNTITASAPEDSGQFFDPAADKIYRHPTFYKLPASVEHM